MIVTSFAISQPHKLCFFSQNTLWWFLLCIVPIRKLRSFINLLFWNLHRRFVLLSPKSLVRDKVGQDTYRWQAINNCPYSALALRSITLITLTYNHSTYSPSWCFTNKKKTKGVKGTSSYRICLCLQNARKIKLNGVSVKLWLDLLPLLKSHGGGGVLHDVNSGTPRWEK